MNSAQGWQLVFLGATALAVVVMAGIQVGAVIYAMRLARRAESLVSRIENEVVPLMNRLTAIGDEAARATSLAVAQVERADRLFADLCVRIDRLMALVEATLAAPAREAMAIFTGIQAALAALRGVSGAARSADDEDALFIG